MKQQVNNLLIIFCIALNSCTQRSNEKDLQVISVNNDDSSFIRVMQFNQRVGIWDEIDKKTGIRVKSFYGYRKDTFEVQSSQYYLMEEPIINLYYRFGHIMDIDVKKADLVSKLLPFLNNQLGEALFYTNCGNCHFYIPEAQNGSFAALLKRKHEQGSLIEYIQQGKRPNKKDSLSLQHLSMDHLDTFEINAIVKFVTTIDTLTIAK
jgi:hypothetical protein